MGKDKTGKKIDSEVDALKKRVSELEQQLASRLEGGSSPYDDLLALFDGIGEAIYICDADTYEILFVNESVRRRVGNVAGQRCHKVFWDSELPCEFCTNSEIFGDNLGKTHVWERKSQRDGRWYRCTDRAIKWRDGRVVRYEMAVDIDSQRRAEQSLRDSEEKFRNLAEQSPSMIFINIGGRIVYANPKCEEVMGYNRSELYDESFSFLDLIVPEHRKLTMENLRKHMSGGDVSPYAYKIVTKDGHVMDSFITTSLINFEGSRAVLGMVTDVSDLMSVRDQLSKSERKLKAQTKELQEKNAALREVLAQIETEKMDTRRQITSNVDKLMKPLLRELKLRISPANLQYIATLEQNLSDLTSEFGVQVSEKMVSLTPREIEICGMIRSGMASKEIAELMGVALRTIETHRNNIRRKLGLDTRDKSLGSYLQSIQ